MNLARLPVAVVGLAGAGKSAASEMLVAHHGFERVYFGAVVLEEVRARGLAPGASSEQLVRESLRAAEGMDVMATRSLPRIERALAGGRSVCVDGLYSRAEWELLARHTGVIVLAVHAPRWLRKQRVAARPDRALSAAELDARDLAEVGALEKAEPIALADAHIVNDGTLEQLRSSLDAVLRRIDLVGASRLRPAGVG